MLKPTVIAAIVALSVTSCRVVRKGDDEPLGKLPNAVTSAEPLWIPFRIVAGRSVAGDERELHLANVRQLTDDGQSRAAVWHPDGRSIVYASAASCQLHRLNLTNGKTERVSPETGWASSPAFGIGHKLIYTYTADAKPPCARGLNAWSDKAADIYSLADGKPAALIEGPTFDGDVDAAVDGSVVFTSTRDGDAELYVASPDGSQVERITNAEGFDGRASFSPDGSKLVWQGVRGKKTRIFTAGARGQHAAALPALGDADITPAFLPDSHHVVFASNYDAATKDADFDLYLVDPSGPAAADGNPRRTRITYAHGFDGYPRFSADGAYVLFTSSRGSDKGGTDIFVARWITDD